MSGPVNDPRQGFTNYKSEFNKSMWYDAKDENWNKLLKFVGDKTISINGKELKVTDIIGCGE